MKLFELFATLSLDTSEFDDGMEDALGQADQLGENIGHGLAKALNGLADFGQWAKGAASTLWDFGREAVEIAADVAAENEQYAATFKGVEDAANEAFAGVAESTGIVAARLRNVGMAAFSQFRGSGMSASVAMETMTRHMMVAADAAAYYNMSYEDADERLRSFLRGNTEAGDAIGLFTSDLQRNEKAMAMYNLKWQNLNEEQRQMVMLNIAEEIYKASGALGQAGREADSYSNMISNLQEQWRQTIGKLGEPLLRNVLPVMGKISDWFEDNPELVSKFGEGIGAVADKLGTMLLDLFDFISNNSDKIIAFLDGVIGIVTQLFDLISGSGNRAAQKIADTMPKEIGFEAGEVDKINEWVAAYQEYLDLKEKASRGAASSADVERAYSRQSDLYSAIPFDLLDRYQRWAGQEGFSLDNPVVLPIDAKLSTGAAGSLQGELDQTDLSVNVTPTFSGWKIPSWLTFLTGTPAFATGLDYVPYNDFGARLHEGEAVLTKAEAEAWRRHGVGGGGAPAIDYNLMAEAMLTAFSSVSLQMDKRVVGGLVGPTVSRDIARGARNRRYTG